MTSYYILSLTYLNIISEFLNGLHCGLALFVSKQHAEVLRRFPDDVRVVYVQHAA